MEDRDGSHQVNQPLLLSVWEIWEKINRSSSRSTLQKVPGPLRSSLVHPQGSEVRTEASKTDVPEAPGELTEEIHKETEV